jgi:uncharacterized protein (TIGR02453 family)
LLTAFRANQWQSHACSHRFRYGNVLTYEYNGRMATTKTEVGDAFSGFSEDALAFLKKLAKNNRREWFQPRKSTYEELLQRPMAQLMFAVESDMKRQRIPLATNPKSVLFRIYRDIRFSADKKPYHTHVSGALHKDGKKNFAGALYIHIGEKESFVGAGFWQPERPALTNWRLQMQAEPEKFLDVIKQLKRKKLELSREQSLQRMPRGFEAMDGSPLAEFLRLQSFVVMHPLTTPDILSSDLPSRIVRFALAAKPLFDYGWSIPQAKPTLFLD